MKSKKRQALADKVAAQMQQLKADRRPDVTGGQALAAIVGIEEVLPREEQPKEIVRLELRDGLRGPERNWTKYPNEIHDVMRDYLRDPSEGIVYMFMFWRSWGFGRNYCRISHNTIMRETVLRSRSTVQRAINGLANRRFVVKCLTDDGVQEKNQDGALYRVISPIEVKDGKTVEGLALNDIPVEGIPIIGIPTIGIPIMNTPAKQAKTKSDKGVPTIDTPDNRYTDKRYTDSEYRSIPTEGIPINGTVEQVSDSSLDSEKYTDNRYTDVEHTIKEDSLKDSLSQEAIISGFYNSIGQTKISREKRERAGVVFEGLRTDGFNVEDIQFAAQWAVENAKEKPYDFSIVQHTIGQALSEKERLLAEREKLEAIEAQAREKKQAEEREREESERIRKHKESLSKDERERLRQRAVAEIKKSPEIKQEFITEQLVEAIENQIITVERAG